MTKISRNILIITYYFPPAGGPGVQRVLKFIKYLPEFGWNPVVITVKNGDFPATDPSLFEDVPDNVPVYRIPALEPYKLYRKLTGKDAQETIPVGVLSREKQNSPLEKLSKWIRANLFIPDARIGWIFPVYRRATHLIRKHNIDAILSSSPPHSLQLSAKMLAKKFKLPWIADLRDPWTEIYYYQHLKRFPISNQLDIKMEKSVLKNADSVTTVSPQLIKQFKSKATGSYFFIPNGFDETDINTTDAIEKDGLFTLSYIGNFKSNQNIKELWKALSEIVQGNQDFAQNFKLKLTGKIHPDIMESLNIFGLDEHLSTEDYVPHSVAVTRMKMASLLLFPIPQAADNKGILTGKIFEYLASGSPLLSIGPPDGDAAKIIKEVDGGPMFDYNEKEGIKKYILKCFRKWQKNSLEKLCPNPDKVKTYNRRELTRQLAQQLNNLVQE